MCTNNIFTTLIGPILVKESKQELHILIRSWPCNSTSQNHTPTLSRGDVRGHYDRHYLHCRGDMLDDTSKNSTYDLISKYSQDPASNNGFVTRISSIHVWKHYGNESNCFFLEILYAWFHFKMHAYQVSTTTSKSITSNISQLNKSRMIQTEQLTCSHN